MNETASCFLHGYFDATLRHCPACQSRRSQVLATAREDIRAGDLIEIDARTGKAQRALPVEVVLDPTMPPGVAEIRDPNGDTAARIENIGFGNVTAAEIGEQALRP